MAETDTVSEEELYAFDYSLEFGDETVTRTPEETMLLEWERLDRETRARQAWRAAPSDEAARFRAAAETVRRLRAEGRGVQEITAAVKMRDPSHVRRLESVIDWLEVAGDNPRAAALAGLSKRSFLAVVGRGIFTVDDLADRAAELARMPAFDEAIVADIKSLLAETLPDSPYCQ